MRQIILRNRRRYGSCTANMRRQQTRCSSSTSFTSCAPPNSTNSHSIITYQALCNKHQNQAYEYAITNIIHRPVTSLLFGRGKNDEKYKRTWHDPTFMQDCTPEEVEKWLLSLLQSSKENADMKGITITNNKNTTLQNNNNNNSIVYFDKSFEVDAIAYLRLLESYVKSKKPSSPQKIEFWLGILERHYKSAVELFHDKFGYDVSHETVSSIQRDNAAAIVRALQPTVECYNCCIEGWGHDNKDLISVVRSRRWLSKLEDEEDDDDDNNNNNNSIIRTPLHPNARSYDLYLASCSRGLGKKSELHMERALEAEEIVQYRLSPDAPIEIRPTTESFNYVLRAYTRCRKDMSVAAKVMDLVLMMERIQKEVILAGENRVNTSGKEWLWKHHVAPNTKTYTMAIDAWIIKASLKAEKWRSEQLGIMNTNKQRGKRNGKTVNNSGIKRVGNSQNNDDGTKEMEKAQTILKYISDLDSIGLADVHATVIGYNTILSGWAKLSNEVRTDIPLKSEKILHDMIALAEQGNANAAPDIYTFNAVIKAWGRIKQANSADRCEFWLRKMIDANKPNSNHDDGEKNFIASPNTATYNLVMDAHSALGNASRVQDMLLQMDATNGIVNPNSESFSKVIRSWLNDELKNQRETSGQSLENAWTWLKELLEREKRGDPDPGPAPELFTAMLKTAAKTVSII